MMDEHELSRYTRGDQWQTKIKSLDKLYEVMTAVCLEDNFVPEQDVVLEVNIVDCLDVIQFHRKGSADYYPPWSEEKDKKTVYPFHRTEYQGFKSFKIPTQTLASLRGKLSGGILLFHDKPVEGDTDEGSILLVDKSGQIKCVWKVLNPKQNFWTVRLYRDIANQPLWVERHFPDVEYLVLYKEKGPTQMVLNWVNDSWKTLVERLL